MNKYMKLLKPRNIILTLALAVISISIAEAQVDYRWLTAGSFHNFYSTIGSEIEEGRIKEQQDGWQWPAIYRGQDAQATKAMWIGAKNVKDPLGGNNWSYRVVHVGPRVTGLGEFTPISMKTVSKYAPPVVMVDGEESFGKSVIYDEVDSSIKADVEIHTEVNSLLGVTVNRVVKQFSNQFHDNYHVIEYTLTNTGNVDDDDEIELQNHTVEDMFFYLQYRMAPVKAARYTINNSAGWGTNTMNDRRGDGLEPEGPEPEQFRAQFAWHGLHPGHQPPPGAPGDYDNVGGPVWIPNTTGGWLTASDTSGALHAYHFVGTVTLHADKSATDKSDDPGQPYTMSEIDSDAIYTNNNSAFSVNEMKTEYEEVMSRGRTPRHAYKIEPAGLSGFINPSKDPITGSGGGWSYIAGYGPYTLEPGESVTIVIAEASAGLDKELANDTGAEFKRGLINKVEKNTIVFQGRDSLFQTFERALANYGSDYEIPPSPLPPSEVFINSAGDGIDIEWEFNGNEGDIEGFQVYRASGRVDSTYTLLYTADPSERSVKDGEVGRGQSPSKFNSSLRVPLRGRDYYYYVVTLGKPNNDNVSGTPQGAQLVSNRYMTQAYDPARLLRPPGDKMSDIRVVPNPYNPNADDAFRLEQERSQDRIAFFEIPGIAKIEIYTEIGELIRTIYHTNGSGDENWDLKTEYRQRVASGIYIARIVNQDPNDIEFGRVVTRKIVIIL